jgi:hypothetical protein
MLLIGWLIAVGIIVALATRLWRADARKPLPLAAASAVTAWVVWDGGVVYRDLIAQSAWTAATVVIPYVPAKASLLAVLAYYALRGLTGFSHLPCSKRLVAALPAGILVFLLVADVLGSMDQARVRTARDATMTAAALEAEVIRVTSGAASRDEVLAFLENPLCPPALLEKYAAEERTFKTQVARNPKVPEEILLRLSRDSDPLVRYYAAYSPNMPETELPRLAADQDPMVRESMAWKKKLPDEDFARLLNDSEARVRATAALQPRTSDEDILRLTGDPDAGVRRNADRIAGQRGLK